MVISVNSQLGLRLNDHQTKLNLLMALKEDVTFVTSKIDEMIKVAEKTDDGMVHIKVQSDEVEENLVHQVFNQRDLMDKVHASIDGESVLSGTNTRYYFICETVYKAAELIKIGDGFTGRTMKDIKPGSYTYLMGKSRCVRFLCKETTIMGLYFDDHENVAFEFGVEKETGEYYFSPKHQKSFTTIAQILVFVELGDIEVKEIPGGQNNGKTKKNGKVTNTSTQSVYVVDSNWNTIVVRTDGFAVRGHFRLQPCGHNFADRKLIWIDAFEKHGYKRRPTGEIVNH